MDIFTLIDAIITIRETVQTAHEAGLLDQHEVLADAFWASFHLVR